MKSSKSKKKYKALILDVDGTIIINKRDAMPSQQVTKAINNASKKIHVGIATSRCYPVARNIIDHLRLSGPSILNGGGEIVDFPSTKHLLTQPLDKPDILQLIKMFKKTKIPFFLCDGKNPDKIFINDKIPDKVFMLCAQGIESDISQKLIAAISHISTVSIYTTRSWSTGKVDILITHLKATKQHAILEVAKILKINTHEIIGVGDGYNDFPLLMACGLKVAMGNAVDDLKAIADYIAPTVDEDGVADVINKFIL